MAAGERPRRAVILLWLSLPFALVALACFVMAQREGGWEGLGWAVYMMGALALWGVVLLGFFLWLMSRDGLFAWHGLPLAVCVLALLGAAAWGALTWHRQATERADVAFWERLAAAPFAERMALLDAEPGRPAAITPASRDMLGLLFVADPEAPLPAGSTAEAERIMTLALLLERGLPPDDATMYLAVANADLVFLSLLLARRGGPPPDRFVELALAMVDPYPASPYHARHDRAVALLRAFVEAGFDPRGPLRPVESFRDAFERQGVPRDLSAAAAERC